MRDVFAVDCQPVRSLNLQHASDLDIFTAARQANAVVMTKDADFVELLEQHGPPPQIILVTCGNTSNERLRRLVQAAWPTLLLMLDSGEILIELRDQFESAS